MSVRTVVVRLRADIEEFRRGLDQAGKAAADQKKALEDLGKVSLASGALMAGGLLLSAKAAIEWESAWAGVTKTVDGSAEQMAVLEGELRGLATTLPASAVEIAGVAEAAGQLGVKREDIVSFTKTMVDLGETTNLTSDEAATSMARLANIMGTAGEDVDRLGSALVALGNDGASTEQEIVDMALRIAGAGKQIGLTEGEVLGFANALSSVGVEAEAGGSSISRVMIDIAQAVEMGGEKLDLFAQVAGVSTAQFRQQFGEDAAGGVNLFIDGLGRMSAAGESTFGVLEQLNLDEIRVRDSLLRLSNAQGLATESTKLGNEAWAANTALVDEANKRYETTEAKLKVARNSIMELAISLGTFLLPAIAGVAESVAGLATFLADLPGPIQGLLVGLAGFTATLGLVGGAAILTIVKINALRASMLALGMSQLAVSLTLGVLAQAMKAAGIVAAAAAIGYALGKLTESILQRDAPAVDEMTTSLTDFANKGKVTGAAADRLGEQFGNIGRTLKIANSNKINIFDGEGAMKINEYRDVLKSLDSTLAGMVTSGNAEQARAAFEELSRQAVAQGRTVEELTASLPEYVEAQRAAGAASETTAGATRKLTEKYGELGPALGTAYDSVLAYTEAMGKGEDETKELIKQTDAWAQSLAGFVQPLGAYTDLLERLTEAEQTEAEKAAEAQNKGVDEKIKATQRDYDARLQKMAKDKALDAKIEAAQSDGRELSAADKVAAAQRDSDADAMSDKAVQRIEDERDKTISALQDTKKGWEDYADAVTVSVKDYLAELEKQVQAQETWQANMLDLSAKVSQGTLDELARMGPEGAPLVAQLVNASDAELAKLDDLFERRTKKATGKMAGEMYLASVLLPQIAAKLGNGLATELALALSRGEIEMSAIAARYASGVTGGITLPAEAAKGALGGIEAKLIAMNGLTSTQTNVTEFVTKERFEEQLNSAFAQAHGGVVDYYAAGGIRENHVAQFAPAGSMRVWAEPETGGEAYIPLAASKRERSRDIWWETGQRLEMFSNGAVLTMTGAGSVSGPTDARQTTTIDRSTTVGVVYASDWLNAEKQLERKQRVGALSGA